jgi:hypothetical protein
VIIAINLYRALEQKKLSREKTSKEPGKNPLSEFFTVKAGHRPE